MTDIKAEDERLGAHPACGWSLFQALRDPVTAPGIHSPQILRSREGAGEGTWLSPLAILIIGSFLGRKEMFPLCPSTALW